MILKGAQGLVRLWMENMRLKQRLRGLKRRLYGCGGQNALHREGSAPAQKRCIHG